MSKQFKRDLQFVGFVGFLALAQFVGLWNTSANHALSAVICVGLWAITCAGAGCLRAYNRVDAARSKTRYGVISLPRPEDRHNFDAHGDMRVCISEDDGEVQ